MRRAPLLREMASAGHLKIVSGVYDLATGNVEWISQEAD